MGQITTGIGLISGLPIGDLVDQLMQIEAQPRRRIEQRNTVLQSQEAALQSVNAKLLSLKSSAFELSRPSNFRATSATSSNESVLTVSSNNFAAPASYSLAVKQLVSSQNTLTRGFADRDATPIPAGTLTFERAEAKLASKTSLDTLNAGQGIERGKLRITDRAGNSAIVDLSTAVTVDDVLNEINATLGVQVLASVDGDALKLTDLTGSTASNLIVQDVGTGGTAASLGLAGSVASDELTGSDINTLGRSTSLSALNDGNGVFRDRNLADFRIVSADASTYDINLAGATTLGDVIDQIQSVSGGAIEASISADGKGLVLTDVNGGGGAAFQVTALNGSTAARDLGVLGNDADADNLIGGSRLIAGLNSKLLRQLNGGAGVATPGTIDIQNRDGVVTSVDLSSAESVADVLAAINDAGAANGISASLNRVGHGILITDSSGGSGDIVISDQGAGTSAADLGLAGTHANTTTVDSGNLQFQYITEATTLRSLKVNKGTVRITDSAGASATINLNQDDVQTIGDVIRKINERSIQVTARINDKGDGILLEDNGPGNTALTVADEGSTTAADLNLLGEADNIGDDIDGSFERTVTVTTDTLLGSTQLDTLRDGQGIDNTNGQAEFQITTRDGTDHDIDLDGAVTIDDVINAIQTQTGNAVTAEINFNKTGFRLTDNSGGSSVPFTIKALNESTAAEELGILKDDNSNNTINGSAIVEVTTLTDLASQISNADVGVAASVVNFGDPSAPFRLSLASRTPGTDGAFLFDDGGIGLDPTNISEAQDAVAFFGGADPASAQVVTSSRNTLDGVIAGATIDLHATSTQPVQVTISRDNAEVADSVQSFVDGFNDVISTIRELDSFDTETEERGLLLGDASLRQVQQSLFNIVLRRNTEADGDLTSLAQVGLTVGDGATLSFDREKFLAALDDDPDAVQRFFTLRETETDDDGNTTITAGGVGVRIDELLGRLTDGEFGPVQRRIDTIQSEVERNESRIEDLNERLAAKRARLEAEFAAMESALARLQEQSQALASFQPLTLNNQSQNRSRNQQ